MTIARPAIVVLSPFGWMRLIGRMYARWQQRQDLRDLDDCLLRDIGIPRDQAERVATQEAAMDRLAEMVQYVRQKNIDRFRELLDEPTDPLRRQQLQQQLAELEAAQQ